MKEKQWYQCQECGELSCADVQANIDELYQILWCPHCRGATKQIFVGANKDEIYENYNLNLDSRYYDYKAK